MTLQDGVSVIICCYNSGDRIQSTLQHLAKQSFDKRVPCELIVVNNASTDDLESVVSSSWIEYGSPFPLEIHFEGNPGLAFARRCGVLHSRYTYGVFCDDDNWLAPNYLSKIIKIFDDNPHIGLVGGCSTPVFETDAPAWFYANCSSYAVGIQAPETGDITHRGFVWGAGMAFRLRVLQSIYEAGIEPLVSDRKKELLTSGGDGEIGSWYIFSNYRIWYDSELTFQHFIPRSRLISSYYEKFLNTNYSTLWPLYHNFIIFSYGVFKNPRRKKIMGLFPLIRRLKAFIYIVRDFSDTLSIYKIYTSIQKLSAITTEENNVENV